MSIAKCKGENCPRIKTECKRYVSPTSNFVIEQPIDKSTNKCYFYLPLQYKTK